MPLSVPDGLTPWPLGQVGKQGGRAVARWIGHGHSKRRSPAAADMKIDNATVHAWQWLPGWMVFARVLGP